MVRESSREPASSGIKWTRSELVTIIDDGTRPKSMRSRPFDGEGVPTQRRVIVDKGVLKGFMYNTIVAKRAGVKSTGNASRGGFTSVPGIGAHNFYMEAGKSSPQDIISATTSAQRNYGLRDRLCQRQFQRRCLRLLDRERQDRLPGERIDCSRKRL